MGAKDVATLGDLVGRIDRLEVRCRRCEAPRLPPVSRRTGATGTSRARGRDRRPARDAGRHPTVQSRPGPGGTGPAVAAGGGLRREGAAALLPRAAEEAGRGGLLGRDALDDLVQLAAVEPDAPALGA